MRRLGLALLATTVLVGSASAADIRRPAYKAPMLAPVSVYNWNGFYVGVNVGYSFGRQDATDSVLSAALTSMASSAAARSATTGK
jgi:outer membrane immunogenic protein